MSGSNRPLSAIEIRSKLTDLGFNLDQFSNPLASIHTALTRMGETNELTLVEKGDEKKKFMPGPEMKSIPETTGALVDPLTGLETPLDKVRKTVGQMMAERGAESRSENK
jgi:hypothetical protein